MNRDQLLRASLTAAYREDAEQALEYMKFLTPDDRRYLGRIVMYVDEKIMLFDQLYMLRIEKSLLMERHKHLVCKIQAACYEQMLNITIKSGFLPEKLKTRAQKTISNPNTDLASKKSKQYLKKCECLIEEIKQKDKDLKELIYKIFRTKDKCGGLDDCNEKLSQYERETGFSKLYEAYVSSK